MRSLIGIVGIGAMTAACIPLQDLSAIGPGLKPPSVTFTGATSADARTGALRRAASP